MAFIIGFILCGVGAYSLVEHPPFNLPVGAVELGTGILFVIYGIVSGRKVRGVESELSEKYRRRAEEESQDLLLLREERDQLAGIVRETKEREDSLTKALQHAEKQIEELKKVQQSSLQGEGAEILLSLFQEKGKFLDFLFANPSQFSDEHVGRVARIVHSGCNQVLSDYMKVTTIAPQEEGSPVVLEKGYDVSTYRVIGSTPSQLPYKGTLVHRGWRLEEIALPHRVDGPRNQKVLFPAEVDTHL